MTKDPYKILGVSKSVTDQELKAAYRKLAFQYHPDKNPGNKQAEEKFKELSEAYSILSNKELRAKYDNQGSSSQDHPNVNPDDHFSNINIYEVFESLFKGAGFAGKRNTGPKGRPYHSDDDVDSFRKKKSAKGKPGQSIELDVELTLEQIASGHKFTGVYLRNIQCKKCNGVGGEGLVNCKSCEGEGVKYKLTNTMLGTMTTSVTCEDCAGTGLFPSIKCQVCNGKGVEQEKNTVNVNCKPGVEDGGKNIVKGLGNFSRFGIPGDLILIIKELPHDIFKRDDDNNIILQKKISFATLVLGGNVIIPTISGKSIKIALSKIDTSKIFRVRDHGIAGGDMLINFEIHVPKAPLNQDEADLLRELNESKNINPDA